MTDFAKIGMTALIDEATGYQEVRDKHELNNHLIDYCGKKLTVAIEKDGDYYTAYCPELELSSYGASEPETIESFREALQIFLEETDRKGTFGKILSEIG